MSTRSPIDYRCIAEANSFCLAFHHMVKINRNMSNILVMSIIKDQCILSKINAFSMTCKIQWNNEIFNQPIMQNYHDVQEILEMLCQYQHFTEYIPLNMHIFSSWFVVFLVTGNKFLRIHVMHFCKLFKIIPLVLGQCVIPNRECKNH